MSENIVRGVVGVGQEQRESLLKGNETTVMGIGGEAQNQMKKPRVANWKIESGARRNYRHLGQRLAESNTRLFRDTTKGLGLVFVADSGDFRRITKGSQLTPILVDSMRLQVTKHGNIVGELPATTHLNAMLFAEVFLREFRPVDLVAKTPVYLADYSLTPPGYYDGGEGQRLLYVGPEPSVVDSTETIRRFLDVMDFASNADRTNTVAAALTVLLRHRWAGEKPVVVVTATKSHSGKGTIIDFLRGAIPKADILYENVDWPMQSQLHRQISNNLDIGMICLDNVRLDSSGGRARCIRSGFLESFATNPEVTLASPGAGEPIRLKNRFILAINTNDGSLSPDLMNRALPIHLAPKGDIEKRQSPIGNPKLEFLPQNQERIEAELRGMIERWKKEGCPLDEEVKHSMTRWAKTVGGILKVNGFSEFLGNYYDRKLISDPIREALVILAAAKPGKALRPLEWSTLAVEQGLIKTLISSHERDSERGRERAIGVLLQRHLEETFEAVTDTMRFRVQLDGGFRRWVKGHNPQTRYIFKIIEEAPLFACEDKCKQIEMTEESNEASNCRNVRQVASVSEQNQNGAITQGVQFSFRGDNPIAEGQKYKNMMKSERKTINQIAREFGKVDVEIRNRLQLLDLTEEEQEAVRVGKVDPYEAVRAYNQRQLENAS